MASTASLNRGRVSTFLPGPPSDPGCSAPCRPPAASDAGSPLPATATPDVRDLHAPVPELPVVEGGFGDAVLAGQIGHLQAISSPLENPDNLLLGKSSALHFQFSFPSILPENSHRYWISSRGKGQSSQKLSKTHGPRTPQLLVAIAPPTRRPTKSPWGAVTKGRPDPGLLSLGKRPPRPSACRNHPLGCGWER